jgi:VIT1/CCC1 family predicted Fe2+/Mn2+ transporter
MKKLHFYLMIMVLSLSIFPSTITAAEKNTAAVTANSNEIPAEVKVMLNRLEEIKEMDKSTMSRSEKKELRKEVKTIKATLKASNHGVYLSIGAIIIIILLLILLL